MPVSSSAPAAALPGWEEVSKLVASDGATDDRFGRAVAVSDSRVVVGSRPNPDYGEVTHRNAQVSIAPFILESFEQYALLVTADLIGLDSGWFWSGWR